jgi:hypothetical protein
VWHSRPTTAFLVINHNIHTISSTVSYTASLLSFVAVSLGNDGAPVTLRDPGRHQTDQESDRTRPPTAFSRVAHHLHHDTVHLVLCRKPPSSITVDITSASPPSIQPAISNHLRTAHHLHVIPVPLYRSPQKAPNTCRSNSSNPTMKREWRKGGFPDMAALSGSPCHIPQ